MHYDRMRSAFRWMEYFFSCPHLRLLPLETLFIVRCER